MRFQVKNSTKTEIRKVGGLPDELKSPAVCFCFSSNSKYLVAADKNRKITVVELRSDENIHVINVLNSDNRGENFHIKYETGSNVTVMYKGFVSYFSIERYYSHYQYVRK